MHALLTRPNSLPLPTALARPHIFGRVLRRLSILSCLRHVMSGDLDFHISTLPFEYWGGRAVAAECMHLQMPANGATQLPFPLLSHVCAQPCADIYKHVPMYRVHRRGCLLVPWASNKGSSGTSSDTASAAAGSWSMPAWGSCIRASQIWPSRARYLDWCPHPCSNAGESPGSATINPPCPGKPHIPSCVRKHCPPQLCQPPRFCIPLRCPARYAVQEFILLLHSDSCTGTWLLSHLLHSQHAFAACTGGSRRSSWPARCVSSRLRI